MTDVLAPMTKLDAVNAMLASIGQTPLNTLDVTGIRDAAIAELALDNTTREVLNKSWSFNSDYLFDLVPNGSGHILIPAGALWVDPTDISKDYVQRWDSGVAKFYDRVNHTFVINENPLKVNIVWSMPFESVPQAARSYIATRAARVFQANVIGSDILFRFTDIHEQEALATLNKMESRTKQLNIFAAPTRENDILHRRSNWTRF